MAQSEGGGNNVAIIALILIGVLVAGALFLYWQGDLGGRSGPSVVERNTVIEREAPKAEAAPVEKDDGGFSLSHETDEGRKTTIEAE